MFTFTITCILKKNWTNFIFLDFTSFLYSQYFLKLTLKQLGEGQSDSSPVVFRKVCLLKRGWNPGSFVTFNIIVSHIFPENLLKLLKSFRRYEGFPWQYQPIFINLHQFFGFFYISLLQRKVKVSKSIINTD